MPVLGFEHHTFMCLACGDIERRLVFARHFEPSRTKPAPLHTASPISPPCTVDSNVAVTLGVVKRIFAKLYRVCPDRLLAGQGETLRATVPSRTMSHTPPAKPVSAPAFQSDSVPKRSSTSLSVVEPSSVPILASSVSSQADRDLDECEILLRRAIDVLRGPPCSSQIKQSRAEETRSAAQTSPIQAESRSTSRIVVQIHHEPKKGKYVAKDTRSGLGVLRHQDNAHLRAMCDRMGWHIVDWAVSGAGE